MDNNKIIEKIQKVADENAKKYIRPAVLDLVYSEEQKDGSTDHYVLGSDMPHLIYRIFNEDSKGNIQEITDFKVITQKSAYYENTVKGTLKLVPPSVVETSDYEIMVENQLDNGSVEIKLKSSSNRNITMIESYRYFDYVSRIFFVGCVSTSFGGLYVFSLIGEGKHLRIINGSDPVVKPRLEMINELFQNRVLPSFLTIDAANKLLLDNKNKARVKLTDDKGKEVEFECNFCYDDYESKNRFAFLARVDNPAEGIIMLCDIFDNNKLILSNGWTDKQKEVAERVSKLLTDNRDEFNKHTCPFFVDNLDFRYEKFKKGELTSAPTSDNNQVKEKNTKAKKTKKK